MATISNIRQWMEASEPDYYMMFVKAFIPYNAWYMTNFYNEDANRTNDRAIMDYMKNAKPGENHYKDRIISLLKNSTTEAMDFKKYVAALHYELRNHPIPNIEEGVSLSQVYLSNEKAEEYDPVEIDDYTYSARNDTTLPKSSPRWILEVINTSTKDTEYMVSIHKPSLHELVHTSDFIELPSDKMREGMKKALNQVIPNRTESVVMREYDGEVKDVPEDSILIGESKKVCLINNRDKIARAIMQIIYELRCKLFHGEIAPTSDYKRVYEYAFYIQKMLIKNLV